MPTDEILTLEIEPPYIGSAVSPTVDIDETTDDITVTITDFRGEHSYTVEKTDQAIEDAEQAAQNANDTAQTVAQGWTNKLAEINGTLAQQREQMGSAARAESQRVDAENARVNAENAREQEWGELSTDATAAIDAANAATLNATSAANRADDSSRVANEMISRGNTTITNISNAANQIFGQAGQAIGEANAAAQSANTAATNADTKAGLADTAAQNADTATTAANNAAQTATTAAEQADAAREAIQDDLATKADKDGYYQQLTAGLADTLMSGDSETVQFAARTSNRDGMASIQSIHGNTVVENDELMSVNIEGIQSAGMTREIPASTYFPDGMRSAGSVYDELTSDKAVTRIGAVDLGTLNWVRSTIGPNPCYSVKLNDAKPPSINTIAFNGVSAVFDTVSRSVLNTEQTKNVIALNIVNDLLIYTPTQYEYISDLKAALSGVMLFYELATPTETEIDPPLNMTYPTEQGGTESIVIPTGEQSAPPTLVTVYAYDADGIVDKSHSVIAPVENGAASTNYAIGSYLVMGGTLYKVTSAIAKGESINPGTNCTATTVMAEIIRLTA